MKKIKLLLIFTFLFNIYLFSQTKISGIVVEKSSGEALPYATIQIKNTSKGTTTNADGYFSLNISNKNNTNLIISSIGFRSTEYKLDLTKKFHKIKVESLSEEIGEIKVIGQSKRIMNMSDKISQITISPKNITALPNLGEKDIFRSMQLLPGVSGSNESSSGLYVRGGTPDQNLVLFDGFTIYHVDHFYGFFSAFNANAIKDVQLYKGAYDAKYGGRVSSVVELTGKTGNNNKVKGGIDISSISGNAFLEIPFSKKISLLVAYRRSFTDFIKTDIYNDIFDLSGNNKKKDKIEGTALSQYTTEPTFYFYDFNTKLSIKPTDKDIISFSFYNGIDNLDNSRDVSENNKLTKFGKSTYSFTNKTNDISKWGNTGFSSKWGRKWNYSIFSNLQVSYSKYFNQRDRSSKTHIIAEELNSEINFGTLEDNNVEEKSIKSSIQYKLNEKNNLHFGVELIENTISYLYNINDTINKIDRNDNSKISSYYIQDQIKFNDKFNLNLGLRNVYYHKLSKLYFEPRISSSYNITNTIKLKCAWGKFNQFSKKVLREDVTQGSRDFWLLADDKDVKVTSSEHYISGISYETKNWLFDIEAYYKNVTGLSEYNTRVNDRYFSENDNYSPFYSGDGKILGAEFLVQKKFGKLTGWISYTLSTISNNFPEISENEFPASNHQQHEFKIVSSYNLKKFQFSATWVFASGKPYTAPKGTYNLNLLDGTSNSYIAVGQKNGERLPNYHRLDLSVNYNFNIEKLKCQLGLSIFNVYNRENVWYKEFEEIENSFVETNINFIGFTPNLFFSIKF